MNLKQYTVFELNVGRFTYVSNRQPDTKEELGNAFGISVSGVNLPFSETSNENRFVARALHVIQQCGGKLIMNNDEIKSTELWQTSGNLEVKDNWRFKRIYGDGTGFDYVEFSKL